MTYKKFVLTHFNYINDNMRVIPKKNNYNFIGELLYLYFRFSKIDIFDYDDIINDIFLAFNEINKIAGSRPHEQQNSQPNKLIINGCLAVGSRVRGAPLKNIKVSKKSIDRYKFLKQVYINFIYKN